MPDASRPVGREWITRAKYRRGVVIEHVSVKLICPTFRNDRDLADPAVLGRVVRHVDAKFLKALDVGRQRTDLRAISAVADSDAIARRVRLVGAAAGGSRRRR